MQTLILKQNFAVRREKIISLYTNEYNMRQDEQTKCTNIDQMADILSVKSNVNDFVLDYRYILRRQTCERRISVLRFVIGQLYGSTNSILFDIAAEV